MFNKEGEDEDYFLYGLSEIHNHPASQPEVVEEHKPISQGINCAVHGDSQPHGQSLASWPLDAHRPLSAAGWAMPTGRSGMGGTCAPPG